MNIHWSGKKPVLFIGILSIGLLLGSLFLILWKPVTLQVDGSIIHTRVFCTGTAADVLSANHVVIGPRDSVSPETDQSLKRNSRIVVNRAFKVKVIADGQKRVILTPPVSVKEAVALAGFTLAPKDIVKTLPVTKTVPNQEIEVIRVKEVEEKFEQPLPFQVQQTTDSTLEKGLSRTIVSGREGRALNTIRITYHNGQEAKREVVKSQILIPPQNQVVAMGVITSVSRGGERFDFREVRYMHASAYTYTGYHTATGCDPAVGMVAVDPAVIPLGTRMYIEGYGYARAADTGGAIKGNKVDLFMEERSQCVNWGKRVVKVYILQ